MSVPVVLRLEAERDPIEARDGYEHRDAGPGHEFIEEVEGVFERLAETPDLYAVVWEDVRTGRPRRFPYVIYDRARADRVEVIAVLHGSRNASVWRSRVGSPAGREIRDRAADPCRRSRAPSPSY